MKVYRENNKDNKKKVYENKKKKSAKWAVCY